MGCDRKAKSTAKRTRGGYGRHERTEADAVQRGHEEACPWDTGTAETEERTYQPQSHSSVLCQRAIDTSERYERNPASVRASDRYERASDTSERASGGSHAACRGGYGRLVPASERARGVKGHCTSERASEIWPSS